jgi:hypothetical protein
LIYFSRFGMLYQENLATLRSNRFSRGLCYKTSLTLFCFCFVLSGIRIKSSSGYFFVILSWDRCYDFKIFSPKNLAKNWRFWHKTKLNYAKILS